MQVRDDGSLILATHNRTYPMATVAPLVPSPCQRWVISGHSTNFVRCPLDPRKRTSFSTVAMSASCQKRTLVIRSKRQPYPSSASILLGRPMTRLRAIVRNRLPARCARSVVE